MATEPRVLNINAINWTTRDTSWIPGQYEIWYFHSHPSYTDIVYVIGDGTNVTGSLDIYAFPFQGATTIGGDAQINGILTVNNRVAVTKTISSSYIANIVNAIGNTTSMIIGNNDYVAGTTGTALAVITGAATGDTYYRLQVVNAGGTGQGPLALNSSGGNVGIGSVSPAANLDISSTANNLKLRVDRPTTTASDQIATFVSNVGGTDTVNCYIEADGDLYNTNGTYGTISDLKLKDNITDATGKLLDLLSVRIVNYELKREPGKKLLGVIAQELEEILPGLIKESDDYAMLPDMDYELKPERIEYKPVTEMIEKEVKPVAYLDGRYVEVIKLEVVESQVMEDVPIYDESGNVLRTERRPKMKAVIIPAETEEDRPLKQQKTGETTKTVKMSVFVPILIKAFQELNAKIEALV